MVFRAMVRDDAHFYDPLGLASRGIAGRFQVGANAYLYGTRFITYLAYTYSPEKVVAWLQARRGQQALLRRPVRAGVRHSARTGLAGMDRVRARIPAHATSTEVRKQPITPHRDLVAGARSGRFRASYYDEASGILYGAFRYPGVVEHVGALNIRDGSVRRLADIKRADALPRHVVRLTTRRSGTVFYTNDNLALRDLMAVDVKTGEERMLLEDARIGEIVFNPVDRSLWGVRHDNGLATLVRIPPPYDAWYRVHEFPYEFVPTDLDISPDGRLLSASMSEVNGDQFLRVWEIEKTPGRGSEAAQRVPLRAIGAGELRVLARRPLPLWQQLLHGRVEHLPLRGRHRRGRGGLERGIRLLPSGAARRRPPRSC